MEVFGTVLIVVCVLAVVAAVISYWGTGKIYSGLGRSGPFSMEEGDHAGGRATGSPSSPGGAAEAREEIRQLLEAKSARREARGQAPLDVDAELAALTASTVSADPGLREEIRQLVEARNERRGRQGKAPLDVEAEVERELRELGGDGGSGRV